MQRFVDSVRESLAIENWYSALMVAVALPDVCGHLESPKMGSATRYQVWFVRYLANRYKHAIGAAGMEHVFLSAADCYALRCALLHEGEDKIIAQRSRDILERFHFTRPLVLQATHCNYFRTPTGDVLQLDVKTFCEDICQGVEKWLSDMMGNKDVQSQMASLATIYRDL